MRISENLGTPEQERKVVEATQLSTARKKEILLKLLPKEQQTKKH